MFTNMQTFIVTPDTPHLGVLFQTFEEKFMIFQPLSDVKDQISRGKNQYSPSAPEEQKIVQKDLLVRLPSIQDSKWKVTVLQRWIGRVERLEVDGFSAVLTDMTNPQNAPEKVELDME